MNSHIYKVKVYYHHTDCGQVVYYGKYLQFLEEARTEFLFSKAVDIKELIRQGNFFVVARQEVDYRAPAYYGDILEVSTDLVEITGVRIDLRHRIERQGGQLVIEARTVLAFVDKGLRPRPIPSTIRDALTSD